MASRASLTITVTSARGSSLITYSSKGKYVSALVNGYGRRMTGQAIQPTSSEQAFWLSVIAAVEADITANP